MKVKIDCNENNELEIIIKCKEVDDGVKQIINLLEEKTYILGKINNQTCQIKITDIYYIEANEDRVFIYCKDKIYETSNRLYELEQQLDKQYFIRISKSIILNLKKLSSVKAYLNGRYEGTLINGERVIITRHYVRNFKNRFGM
ncbi:LytTR family DNA-binding domain-containing protein [uncultured Thomasclavelia sp.]|uniref:LytTR family DNA-binding domain-containing protein n=1 Tax=uncultured Thomasclavelia sp. TaxID=3025759 RepID=UPI0025FB2C1F|nr:LytTR family DNA-binding domain-containing protein [uncultured Thomasclavelia sp.]